MMLLALLLTLVACNTTEYSDSTNVIEASELKGMLGDSNLIVIDARSGEDYGKGHMEGAIHLPPSKLTVSEPVSGLIAPKEKVEEVLGAHGITPESKVVVYDNKGGVYSGRVWWVLNVYGHEWVKVVNGGDHAIVNAGISLSADAPEISKTTYTAMDQNASMIASLEQVQAIADGTAEGCIIDVRSQAEYDEGAIPTATLYPHTKNLYSDGTFKSARDIYLNYNDLGVCREEPVILYGKSSYRATQTLMLLEEAGYDNVKVYDGAWLEWSTKDMPKAEKVEQTAPSSQDAS
jgi:thiosulfate/3-mercaptopyruvate sulfurtransferase